MKPIIFGEAGRQLYGVFHPAQSGKRRHSAVLLCYPHVTEYNVIHRAFRQIALTLSSEGYDVFRFDYSGTGDSAGDVAEFGMDQWVSDIAVAAQELRELARVDQLSLVGRQLGAILAARAITRGLSASRLIMWEPVIDGKSFVVNLEDAHRHDSIARLQPKSEGEWPWQELLGFPFPLTHRREIESILLWDELPNNVKVMVIRAKDDTTNESYERLRARVESSSGPNGAGLSGARMVMGEEPQVLAGTGQLVRLVEMADVPKYNARSIRQGIVAAGTVPGRIAELINESWDSE